MAIKATLAQRQMTSHAVYRGLNLEQLRLVLQALCFTSRMQFDFVAKWVDELLLLPDPQLSEVVCYLVVAVSARHLYA